MDYIHVLRGIFFFVPLFYVYFSRVGAGTKILGTTTTQCTLDLSYRYLSLTEEYHRYSTSGIQLFGSEIAIFETNLWGRIIPPPTSFGRFLNSRKSDGTVYKLNKIPMNRTTSDWETTVITVFPKGMIYYHPSTWDVQFCIFIYSSASSS